MKVLVVVLILALCVAHHDLWWWDSPKPGESGGVWFGFLPVGLGWHTAISLGASAVWFLAVRFCWPAILDEAELNDAQEEGA